MSRLMWTISTIAMAGVMASPAWSQDQSEPAEPETAQSDPVAEDEDNEITVIGFVKATREAIQDKRKAGGIADFLAQDDLGRVPDLNVVESLQRLPGVLSVFDEDEGRYIAVRGLASTFTNIAVDGSTIAALDKTQRRPNLESVPPSAVKVLEVYKTLTPDIDAASIGGFINLRTRSAYDQADPFIAAQVLIGDHSAQYIPVADNKLSVNSNMTVATQFGESNQFGIVAYGTYFEKTRDQTKNNRTNGFINDLPVTRTVIPLDYANTIDRYSFGGKLEFKPSDYFYIYAQASRYYYNYDDEFRWNTRLDGNTGTLVQDGEAGTFGAARARASTVRFPLDLDLEFYQVGSEWNALGGAFDIQGSFSKAGWIEPNDLVNFDAGTSPDFGYSYDFGNLTSTGLAPISYANAEAVSDLSRYGFQNYETDFVDLDEEVYEITANYSYNATTLDRGLGFKTGLRYRDLDRNYNRDRFRFTYEGDQTLTYELIASPTSYEPARTPGVPQIFGDLQTWLDFFAANRNDFVDDGSAELRSLQSDYGVNEEVTAAYAMVTFATERFRAVGGVRYEHTNVQARSFFDNNGVPEVQVRESSYDDFLPSVQLRYDFTDRLRITAGYAQAIGRPNHPDLALRVAIDEADDGSVRITQGNPNLRPRRSDNFDVSLDWFFQPGGLVSVALFHKDIADEIFRVTSDEIIDGQLVTTSQPTNSTGARVSGLELSIIDDQMDFLPGFLSDFGFNFNLTLLDGSIDVVDGNGAFLRESDGLVEAPETILNFSLLYANGPFDARFAVSYTDQYFQRIGAQPIDDRLEADYTQLDLNLRYRFTDQIATSFEVRNIADAPRRFIRTNGLISGVNDFGRSIWLGFNFTY